MMGRRAGATPLTPQRIYDEGLAIIDAEGLEGLTMRKLGSALGVDPMAIYHHVPHKQALFHGIVRRVFAQMPKPEASDPWASAVRGWAHAYRSVIEAHPNLVLKIVSNPDAVRVAAGQANEALYRALEGAGIPPADVARGADVVVDYVNGSMLATANGSVATDPALRRELDSAFEFGLDVIIAGLEARIASEAAPPRTPGAGPEWRRSTPSNGGPAQR